MNTAAQNVNDQDLQDIENDIKRVEEYVDSHPLPVAEPFDPASGVKTVDETVTNPIPHEAVSNAVASVLLSPDLDVGPLLSKKNLRARGWTLVQIAALGQPDGLIKTGGKGRPSFGFSEERCEAFERANGMSEEYSAE